MIAATKIGEPTAIAIIFFILFIVGSLGISTWAARRTRSAEQFYAPVGIEISRATPPNLAWKLM